MIGLINESQGDRTAARAQYAAALARDPAAGVAANNLAWLNAEDGQLDEALRLATTARQTLGSRPEVEDTIGWVHFRRGAYREAVQSLRRAVELAPDRARYHFHLGMALSEAGDTASSAAALKRALSLGLSGNEAEQAAAELRGHQL